MTTYYLSKYALGRKGKIEAADCEVSGDGRYVRQGYGYLLLGRDAHITPEAATAAAEAARLKKIASLKKQLAALEKMKFSVEGQ